MGGAEQPQHRLDARGDGLSKHCASGGRVDRIAGCARARASGMHGWQHVRLAT
jgi:hypothetical protein